MDIEFSEAKGRTPGQLKDVTEATKEVVRGLEEQVERQKQHNAGYYDVSHELTEAWEALDRASMALDDMEKGLT